MRRAICLTMLRARRAHEDIFLHLTGAGYIRSSGYRQADVNGAMRITTVLARYLGQRDSLSGEEEGILESLPSGVRRVEAGREFVEVGSHPGSSCLVVSGFAGRIQFLASGKRQITAVHVPGDFVDLHSLLLKIMDHGVVALTDCEIATVPHAALRRLTETHPHLTRLLWMSTTVDAAIHRAWIASMGRRSVEEQIAHLMCELFLRLRVVGKTDGNTFRFPVTQAVLADMLGKSNVHVNRALQSLRRMKAIAWQNQIVTILDWEALETFAEFDSTYLSLHSEAR